MTSRYNINQNDPHRIHMLDIEDRGKWLKFGELIKECGIVPGMSCIDLGCGAGALSFPLVTAVGKNGTVYAVDNANKAIDHIREKNPPENLIIVNGDAARTGLEGGIADVCFIILVLHELETPSEVLAEAFRLLKPGGKTLVLEWRNEPDSPGPPHAERIGSEEMEKLFNDAGFTDCLSKEWSRSVYIITGSKNTPA